MTAPNPPTSPENETAAPARRLSLFDTTCIIVGIIIGSAIFEALPFIAYNMVRPSHEAYGWFVAFTSGRGELGLEEAQRAAYQGAAGIEYELVAGAGLRFAWALGGVLALIGALCFAELATAYPQDGGSYVYLTRAFGRRVGLAFVWVEFLLVRPGSLGAVAFVAAVYAQQLLPLQTVWLSPETWWAIMLVAAITLVNLIGFQLEKWMQNGLTLAKVLGLLTVALVAWTWPAPLDYQVPENRWLNGPPQSFAVAMTLIMFAYGGWSDMVYVAAEVREPKKNLFRALLLGVCAVTVIYLCVVHGFLSAVPYRGIRNGSAVAAEIMTMHFGPAGGRCISALIVVSCLGSVHGMLFTSSRAFFAAGSEHRLIGWLGAWNSRLGVPLRALFAQGALTLLLIAVFGQTQNGFQQLVNFTAPFYYGFLGLVALGLIVLRYRDKKRERLYQVPFYPFTPLIFGLTSLWLSFATTQYLIDNLRGWQWAWVAVVIGSAAIALAIDRPREANLIKQP